ncbi:MAG: cation-translocating P-type ATPase [Candidatus Caldarchaeum sp.]|nr:cation-translocating P-type ATPase [Candidatus Caldarchaeum sp.]MDW8359118.1 cation-translocating P-type ATPase [Candidatus Caldarchaeum sp.]
MAEPRAWHAHSVEEVISLLNTDREKGLSSEEALNRLSRYGPNMLEPVPKPSALRIFLKQFANILVGLLIAALVISGFLGEVVDSVVIGVIVFFVAVVGFLQEYRAEKTLETLKKMLTPTTSVVRDGVEKEVAVKEVVPGDVVLLSAGSRVPADLRLFEAVNLQVDEAPLTGESTPVAKTTDPLPANTAMGDRVNMAYAGTTVTYGRGRGVVVATGRHTEFGKIAEAAAGVAEEKTPLEVRMNEVGKRFAIIAVVIIAAIILAELVGELLAGAVSLSFMVEVLLFAVALAVAVVPEALPGIVTATLAIGMGIMARRNALVRRMPAVETLGSTQVICFDKTGTLTMNKMTVRRIYADGTVYEVKSAPTLTPSIKLLTQASVLCNDASIAKENGRQVFQGDPTEAALLMMAEEFGVGVSDVRKSYPRFYEVPFTSERKMMTTVHKTPEGRSIAFMKGALEVVLDRCSRIYIHDKPAPITEEHRRKIYSVAEEMAQNALRVLAVAYREVEIIDQRVEEDFTFVGLVGMMDPPRPDAVEAVQKAHSAGIKTVMLTGDHKLTALAIAKEVGMYKEGDMVLTGLELEQLSDEEFDKIVENVVVYARISPIHKLRIVEAWRKKGYVVAMTGDGVNDAPALKKADIGIATGITGTDVAKESSDMILADDNFATIVKAVELGRWIYGNVKKYLAYLLEANLVEIIVISAVALFVSRLFGLQGEDTLPLLPIHILYINLATDGLPAIALGFSPADPDIMKRKPIPRNEPVFSRDVMNFLITVMAVATPLYLLGYITALSEGVDQARSRLFFMFFVNELLLALNCRSLTHNIHRVRPHKWLVLAILWEIALISAIMAVPGGAQIIRLQPPTMGDLAWILGGGVLLFSAVELVKFITRRREG